MERKQELLCAAAGPLGSLLLLFVIRRFPLLAICGGIQGFTNLLPFYPMDGGRIVRLLMGERWVCRISRIAGTALLVVGAALTLSMDLGPVPLILGGYFAARGWEIKYFLQTGQTHSTIGLPIFKR